MDRTLQSKIQAGSSDFDPNMWKSSLLFTGDNPEYPVEMFIALMENKRKQRDLHVDDKTFIKDVLSYIPDIQHEKICSDNDACFPSTLWKTREIDTIFTLDWENVKKKLLDEFGQNTNYSIEDKLIFCIQVDWVWMRIRIDISLGLR